MFFPIISLWQIMTPPGRGQCGPQDHDWQAWLHTKYIGFRPCGFREDFFFIFSQYKPMLDNDAPGAWQIWAQGHGWQDL